MDLKKIDMLETGFKLKKLRLNKRITQRELGEKIGLTTTLVSCLERGAVNLTMEML